MISIKSRKVLTLSAPCLFRIGESGRRGNVKAVAPGSINVRGISCGSRLVALLESPATDAQADEVGDSVTASDRRPRLKKNFASIGLLGFDCTGEGCTGEDCRLLDSLPCDEPALS